MSKKQTMRLSLITAAVLVVLLCLVGVFALNVSNQSANASQIASYYVDIDGTYSIDARIDYNDGVNNYKVWDYDPSGTLSFDLGTNVGAVIDAAFMKESNAVTVGRYYAAKVGDDYGPRTTTAPTHAGEYKVGWFDAETDPYGNLQDQLAIAEIKFEIKHKEVPISVDYSEPFVYTGNFLDVTVTVDALYSSDFTVRVDWVNYYEVSVETILDGETQYYKESGLEKVLATAGEDYEIGSTPSILLYTKSTDRPKNPGKYNYKLVLVEKEGTSKDADDYYMTPDWGRVEVKARKLDVVIAGTVPYTGAPQCVVDVNYQAQTTYEMNLSNSEFLALVSSYAALDDVYTKTYTYDPDVGKDATQSGLGDWTCGIDIKEEYRDRYYIYTMPEWSEEEQDYIDAPYYDMYAGQIIAQADASYANAAISFGGEEGFGSDFMVGEDNFWGAGKTISDRIVVDFTDLPGVDGLDLAATPDWGYASGRYTNDTNAGSGAWYALNDFPANTAVVDQDYTIRVKINGNTNYSEGYIYLPFTVQKVKLFVRPNYDLDGDTTTAYDDATSYTYTGSAIAPLIKVYQYKISSATKLSGNIVYNDITVAKTNVGTYDLELEIADGYEGDNEFVADEGAKFTITAAVLDPSLTLAAYSLEYGTAANVTLAGVNQGDMLGSDEKPSQGITEVFYYRYSATNPADWDAIDWTESVSNGAFTEVKNVGYYQLKYDFVCEGTTEGGYINYASNGASIVNVSVTKKYLALVVDAKETTYGEAAPTFTVSSDDFAYDETPAVLGGSNHFTCAYDINDENNRAATTYTISIDNYTSDNYEIYQGNTGTLTVNPRPVTYTVVAKSSTYGDDLVGCSATLTTGTLASWDESVNISYALYEVYDDSDPEKENWIIVPLTGTSPAGEYDIVAIDDDSNYDITILNNVKYTITNATLTVTLEPSANDLYYNGNPQTPTINKTISSVNSQAITYKYSKTYDADGTDYVDLAEITYTNVADSGTLYYYYTAPNHNATAGSFTVTMNTVNATWTDPTAPVSTLYYNGSAQNLVVAPTDVVGGEVKYSTDNGDSWGTSVPFATGAGNYAVIVKIFADGNHNDISALINVTINKVTITITPEAGQSKTYGEDDGALTYTTSDAIGEEEIVLTGALARAEGENYGTYAINIGSLALTDDDVNANYEIELAAETVYFAIDKKALVITFSTEAVYNGLNRRPAVQKENEEWLVEGLQFEDAWETDINVNWTDGYTINAGTHIGDGALNFEFTGTKAGNYTHATFKQDFEITPRPLTVNWGLDNIVSFSGASVEYNGQEHTVVAVVADGLVGGDADVTLNISGDTTATNANNNSTYTVTLTTGAYKATGSENYNYTIPADLENKTFIWTIYKKNVTISGIVAQDKVYDGTNTATFSNTLELNYNYDGENLVPTISGTFADANASNTAITVNYTLGLEGSAADNYALSVSAGSTTAYIAPKDISDATITLDNDVLTYNGQEQTKNVVSVYVGTLEVSPYIYDGNKATNAGNHTLTVSGTDNFTGSATAEWSIAKKEATITVNNSNRTYGQALSIDVTDSGILDADKALAYSTIVLAYDAENKSVSSVMDITTANVGTYYILVGTGSANYDFTINYVNGTSIDVKSTPEADPIATEVCTYTINNAAAGITNAPSGIANLVYTGAAIVLVTDGEATNGHFEYKVDDSAWVIAANAKATNAGTHTIVYRVVGDANDSNLEDDKNYTFTVTIAKRGVVVTLSEPASYVYSAGAKELTGTYKTWADGAETNVTAAATVSLKDGDDNVNVGTFHYIISIDDGNYTVAEAANASIYAYDNDSEKWIATRAVTAADLANASVAQNGALTYNGGDQTANVTTEGATTIGSNAISYVYSESLTGTYTAAVPAFTTAGEHTVYYTASADNHNDYAGTFTVTIAKKALTIKADNKNVEYGENAPAFTYSFDGFVNNETDAVLEDVASISLSCSYVAQPTPGTYTAAGTTCDINVAGSVTADNYAISYEKGTLTVDKRGLTLNINHVEVEYGQNVRSYCGYTVAEGGIIDGADVLDNDNVYYYIDSFDAYELFDNAVGASGSISFDYNSAPTVVKNNYRIDTVNNGTWTIVKKNVSSGITIEVGELTYNGAVQTIGITVKYGDVVMVEGTDYTVEDNSATAAGNYELCIHGIGNYTGNKTAEWSIAPKPITVVNVNEEHLEVVYGDAETLQVTNPAAYIGLKDGFALAEGDTLAEIIAVSVDVNGNPVQSLEDVWNVNKYYLHVYDEFDEIKFDSNYTVTVELDEEAYLEIVKRPITIAYTKNEKVQIVFDPGAYIEYELTSLVMENYSLFELIEGTLADGDNDLSGVITIYSEEFEAFVETIEADFSNYFKVLGTYAIDVKDEQGNYEITLVEDANCAFEIVERPLYVVPADGQSKIYGEVDGEIVYIDLLTDNWTYDNEKQEWVCTRETIFKGNAPVAPVAPEGEEIVDVPDPEDYENDEEGYQAAMEAFSAWEDYREAVELYEQQLAIYEAEIAEYRALIFGLLEGNLGRVEGENAGAYAITIGNLHFKALPAEPVAQPVYDEYVADLPEEPEEPEEPAEPAELEAYAQAYAEWLEQYDAAMAEYNAAVAAYQEYGTLVGYKAFYELRIDEAAKYFTIGAKAITITAANKTSVYGDAIATLTATDTGIVAGDEASDVYTLAKAAGNNVGTYAITVVPANNANYVVTGVPAVYTITAKAITVTAENKQSAYGDAIATLTATADLVGDDVASEVYTLTKAAGNNVGTYAITVNVANNANYVVTAVNGTYTIVKKAITFSLYVDGVAVNGTDAIKVYDGQQHTFVIKALGAGNEIITLSTEDLTTVASVTASFEPGDFAADGAQVENYVLAQGATFNYGISAKPIDAIVYKIDGVVKNSVEYDGQNHGVIAYATDVEGNLFEIGGGPGKEAGSYTVTVEAGSYNDNYVLAETATFAWSITEKAAVVDPETGAKDYAKEISDKDAASDTGVNVTDLFKKADSEKTDDVESEVTITIKSGEGEEAKTGTIVFDKAAIAQLAGAANVALKVNVTSDVEEIAEIVAVKETLKGAEMVINVSLGNATFESGKATLTFDFDKQAPKGMIGKVYYVDADGNRTDMKATFANGKVTFETTHFSDYIVVFEKAPGLSGGAIAGIVIACVVVAAGIAVGIFFLLKKKKGNGGSATTAGEAAATETAAE